jgi:DNA-binding phage protein
MKNRLAKSLPEYKEIDFDAEDVISGVKFSNQATISFTDDLVESLKRDTEAQINFINSTLEDCSDSPATILRALQIVAESQELSETAIKDCLNLRNDMDKFLGLAKLVGFKISVSLRS